MKLILWFFRLTLIAAVMAFCVANRDSMIVSFYPLPYEMERPKFFFILLLFTLGMLVGFTANSFRLMGARRHEKKLNQRIDALEDELNSLRTEARHTTPQLPAIRNP